MQRGKLVLVMSTVLAISSPLAAERKVSRKSLPPAVQTAVDELSKSGQLLGVSKETEKGQTLYEISVKIDGKTRDTTVNAQGQTVTVEQQVDLGTLPGPVQEGLKKGAGKGRITLVETITKGDRVTYEAAVKGGPKKEVVVDGTGAPVVE